MESGRGTSVSASTAPGGRSASGRGTARRDGGSRVTASSAVRVTSTPSRGAAQSRRPAGTSTEVRTATLRLPFVTAHFEVSPPTAPGSQVRLGPLSLPAPGRTAYYLGLGTLAVVELIEWPVALAIAAGTYVAGHAMGPQAAAARAGEAEVEISAELPTGLGPRGLWRRFRHAEHGLGGLSGGTDHNGNGHRERGHEGHGHERRGQNGFRGGGAVRPR
ncbi:hypothetical protein [Frankia gtarii]|uniref:hypothetical protein n=1 Tax=Frankia gtarii TaxID=2950102 RepID=UPI0021C15FEA|nr:hypothetical protein [Frankia gtarii]